MEKDLITIVLPIYNVEKYLDRCMESVINQTYKNLEIIMVDDGSPDNCPKICDDWALKDNRVKVIHKKNAGLGMARNTGIENATGKYICFFDSDDFINKNAIELLYNEVLKNSSDLVLFGHSDVDKDNNIVNQIIPLALKKIYQNDEITKIVLPDLIAQGEHGRVIKNLWMSAWSCMYSMDLINKTRWRFVSEREIISEDVYSLLVLFRHVKKVSILSEALYFYCENATSLTHVYREDRFEKINKFYDSCLNECKNLNYDIHISNMLVYPYIANVIAALKMICESNINKNQKIECIKSILRNNTLQSVLKIIDLNNENKPRKLLIVSMKKKNALLTYILIMGKSVMRKK